MKKTTCTVNAEAPVSENFRTFKSDEARKDHEMTGLEESAGSKWEKAGIGNDLIFSYVMQSKELFLTLVQRICPELQLARIEEHTVQKTEKGPAESRGVRFDVYSRIDGKYFDIEMQMRQEGDERRRTRYYQCLMDERELHVGDPYSDLPDSYIIMIGCFDIFGKGRHIYRFKNYDMTDHELELGDGTTKIFLNSKGTEDDIPQDLRNFLELVNGLTPADDFCRKVNQEVEKAKQDARLRRQYMDLQDKLRHERNRALQEGVLKGLAQGKIETLVVLVRRGSITMAEASELSGLTEKEFADAMNRLV